MQHATWNMEPATDLVLYRVNKGHSTCTADVAQALSGQTLADWSAIYAQYTIEHAERYLPNRWDDMTVAELIELRVAKDKSTHYSSDNEIRIIPLLDDWMRESARSSTEKAEMVRQALKERFGIVLCATEPLLQALGGHKCVLKTWDNEDDLECIIPHNLLEGAVGDGKTTVGFFQYRVLKRYYRHPQYPVTLREEDVGG